MLEIKGKNASLILERLKDWRLEDATGIEGDSLTLKINSQDITGLPAKGEQYQIQVNGVKRGTFSISKRSFSVVPCEITLVLTVAAFSVKDESGWRERRSASWDNATISKIVSDCVTPHGYTSFVHPELQKIVIQHIDQTDQSAQAFLVRLARHYDAVAKPVEGQFVFVPIGKEKSASGKDIDAITLSMPAVNRPGDDRYVNVTGDLDGRNEFKGVKAFYLETSKGQRVTVSKGSAPFKRLVKDKGNEIDAIQACASELRKINREGRKISLEAPLLASAFAEGLLILDNSFDALIRGKYSIDNVSMGASGRQVPRMNITATLTGDE